MKMFSRRLAIVGLCMLTIALAGAAIMPTCHEVDQLSQVDRQEESRRRPIALDISTDGRWMLVANQRSHSLSVIDMGSRSVSSEWQLGGSPADVIHWRDNHFLCLDQTNHQLICMAIDSDGELAVSWKVDCVRYPRTVTIGADGKTCWVGGLWSRQVMQIDLPVQGESADSESQVIDLGLAVGNLIQLDEERILALDAFGDRFAVINMNSAEITNSGNLAARRSGGASRVPNSSEIVLAQQLLNPLAHSVRNDVHWGLMVANDLRKIDAERFFEEPLDLGDLPSIPMGGAGDAKGDPGEIVFDELGQIVVSIGGVNQIAIGDLDGSGFAFVDVGRRPLALAAGKKDQVFVANHLDDSISVVSTAELEVVHTIELGNTPEPTLTDRGEELFFDASLSHDSWMSCHSCHIDGHTSGLLNDNLSDQSFGAPKRVLSLLGHADTAPFAWNGSADELGEQIRKSISSTMQSDSTPDDEMIEALVAFVETLPPPPSIDEARATQDIAAIERGGKLFSDLNCRNCHDGERYTSSEVYEVGLQDELGNTKFNPPSLIGVGQRMAYFHDGRAATLAEVVGEYEHQITRELSPQEQRDLLSFLRSL